MYNFIVWYKPNSKSTSYTNCIEIRNCDSEEEAEYEARMAVKHDKNFIFEAEEI